MIDFTIHCGDCLRWLKRQAPADLIFADPPFNVGFGYDVYNDRRKPTDYLAWCREWITAAAAVLKPNGAFWIAIGDEYAAEICLLMKDAGLAMRNWCIWHYTFGPHLTAKFGRNKVHLLYFTKGKPAYFKPPRIESERQRIGDKRANPIGRVPGDVWTYSRLPGNAIERTGHPCQMPVAVLSRIIVSTCPPRGRVLDPFAGSGTTLEAAVRAGRSAGGCEISPDYVEMIWNRMLPVRASE